MKQIVLVFMETTPFHMVNGSRTRPRGPKTHKARKKTGLELMLKLMVPNRLHREPPQGVECENPGDATERANDYL